MSWSIDVKGNRMEIQNAVNTTANMPDSVKGFVANATAYYTEDTQLSFKSYGHAVEGLIQSCQISLGAQLPVQATNPIAETDPAVPTQLPADTPPAQATQLPADAAQPKKK